MKILLLIALLVGLQACTHSKEQKPAAKVAPAAVEPAFRVAFGSCNNQDKPQIFWPNILRYNPRVWVWLGDNVYGDTRVPRVLESKYKKLQNDPQYKAFASQLRVTGTWDDHDYGENDAGADFPMKRRSKDFFWDFMQVPPDSVLRSQDGVYRSEDWSVGTKKAKLILLDARYNRDPLKQNQYHEYLASDGDILGPAQWRWLESEIAEAKDMDALVIANGTQVLSDQHRFEKWANFPKSRARLLTLIEKSPVKIKILLSGDRHVGEIAQHTFQDGSKVTEVTSSGLTHSYEAAAEPNAYRIGELWKHTHFGLMDFFEDARGLRVVLSLRDLASDREVNRVELKGAANVPAANGN